MEKYCISVDWLQTFNHAAPLREGTFATADYIFNVKKEKHETPLFLDVFTVRWKKMKVATILQRPRTPVINPRATSVKLENRVLYCTKYIDLLYNINRALSLTYKGITRLDLCYDCNRLHNGRDVGRFLRQYISKQPLTRGHIIRSGSSRFIAHGTRTFTSISNISAMRWGSPSCDITAYCYDKTLEMCEVKVKPWILDVWDANGIEYDVDFAAIDKLERKERAKKVENGEMSEYIKRKVWRFEISISAKGQDILDMSSGLLFRLSPSYLDHYNQIAKLFYTYAARVFDFRINDGCKRIRDYKPLHLFEVSEQITTKPYTLNKCADTGRIEKICYNTLQRLNAEYNDMAEPIRNSILTVLDFLAVLSGKKFGIVEHQRQAKYLDQLRAMKFMASDDVLYFSTLEVARRTRREMDAEAIYYIMYQNKSPNLEELIKAYHAAPLPRPIDQTPENYTW